MPPLITGLAFTQGTLLERVPHIGGILNSEPYPVISDLGSRTPNFIIVPGSHIAVMFLLPIQWVLCY